MGSAIASCLHAWPYITVRCFEVPIGQLIELQAQRTLDTPTFASWVDSLPETEP